MAAVKAVPVVSFIILALVWLDSDSLALFISALMVFPPSTSTCWRASGRRTGSFWRWPGCSACPSGGSCGASGCRRCCPYFRSAASLALGLCWKAGVAAEVIGLPAGTVGERLYTAKVYFQTPDLFALDCRDRGGVHGF